MPSQARMRIGNARVAESESDATAKTIPMPNEAEANAIGYSHHGGTLASHFAWPSHNNQRACPRSTHTANRPRNASRALRFIPTSTDRSSIRAPLFLEDASISCVDNPSHFPRARSRKVAFVGKHLLRNHLGMHRAAMTRIPIMSLPGDLI